MRVQNSTCSKNTECVMDSKRLVDALKQIPLQILLLITSGLIAVFAMMIPGLIFKAVIWFSNANVDEVVVGFDYIITGIIGLIASVIAMYQFMKKPGVDDAILAQRSKGDSAKLNVILPTMIVVISVGVYFLICWVANFQFIAGPVQYFAPYFEGATINFDFADVSFTNKLISFVILIACEIPAMYFGYIKGFKARMAGKSLV